MPTTPATTGPGRKKTAVIVLMVNMVYVTLHDRDDAYEIF